MSRYFLLIPTILLFLPGCISNTFRYANIVEGGFTYVEQSPPVVIDWEKGKWGMIDRSNSSFEKLVFVDSKEVPKKRFIFHRVCFGGAYHLESSKRKLINDVVESRIKSSSDGFRNEIVQWNIPGPFKTNLLYREISDKNDTCYNLMFVEGRNGVTLIASSEEGSNDAKDFLVSIYYKMELKTSKEISNFITNFDNEASNKKNP
jgi:hypothetical protein